MALRKPFTVYSYRGVAYINAHVGATRVRESLGVPYDPKQASAGERRAVETAASKRYADLISGRVLAPKGARITTLNTLEELLALWIEDAKQTYPRTQKLVVIMARHFETFANTGDEKDKRTPLERLMEDTSPRAYAISRIRSILRMTVNKEISWLFRFYEWCKAEKHIASLPDRPDLPKGLTGVRSGTQRSEPVQITHEEALMIIELTPEWAAKGGRNHGEHSKGAFRVRDALRLSYETGLRPSTLQKISVPEHYTHGSPTLKVTADIDKSSNERRVPLTEAAREILDRCAPAKGLIFGAHDFRDHIKAAALQVLSPEKAEDFARYDLRHGRARSLLAASSNLLGVAHMLGHKRLTTTNRYLKTREEDASEVVNSVNNLSTAEGPLNVENETPEKQVRRRGLEPLRFYPLAPQATGEQAFRALSSLVEGLETSIIPDEPQGDVESRSTFCQQARALFVEGLVWESFDGLTLAEGGDE